jgi:hypothetical protein
VSLILDKFVKEKYISGKRLSATVSAQTANPWMFRCPRANSIDVSEMSRGTFPHLVICPTRQSSDTIFNYRWVRFGGFSSEEFAHKDIPDLTFSSKQALK